MEESGWNPSRGGDRSSDSPSPSKQQAGSQRQIVIIEDNPADVFLIREAVEAAFPDSEIHVIRDGEKAVRFFDERDSNAAAPCPDLVLLDINIPKKHGGEVLAYMRNSRRCAQAYVVAVSSSNSSEDRERMIKLGANAYFHKASEYSEFMKLSGVIKAILSA